MVKRIKAYRKFCKGERVVIVNTVFLNGEVGTVREEKCKDRVVVECRGHCINLLKENVMRAEEAKKQALKPKEPVQHEQVTESTWVLMGGYPACMNCGCSPAEWEDGFPPYCHSCGARMTNGRK